ncbi:hypothetical protein OUZ56_004492 [Daphnia magna]|uniref:Uncharacterized protein n=1 Tax=Daphnia magna TaxID=35525 RepID=A0ABQ9YQ25_9CRUS|nr:hypothetical protein OUZ56_004492 [Daphnia magna]
MKLYRIHQFFIQQLPGSWRRRLSFLLVNGVRNVKPTILTATPCIERRSYLVTAQVQAGFSHSLEVQNWTIGKHQ